MLTITCKMCGIDNEDEIKCFACGSGLSGSAKVDALGYTIPTDGEPARLTAADWGMSDATKATALDRLTRDVTAFATWGEFRKAMTGGYVPTLWPRKLKRNASAASRLWEEKVAKLAAMVRAEGFRVFDGMRVA